MKPKFEIINHGYEHAQYFQGQGTAFTDYDIAVTGCGMNEKEAYEEAVEQVYQINDQADKLHLPKRPRGINAKNRVPARLMGEDSEYYWYVSILF